MDLPTFVPHVGHVINHNCGVVGELEKQLGKFLKEKRGELTLRQFAPKVGVSRSTLERLERGGQNVTLKTVRIILDKLKVKLSDIFPGS